MLVCHVKLCPITKQSDEARDAMLESVEIKLSANCCLNEIVYEVSAASRFHDEQLSHP
jgi:hypothetical protein